MTEVADEPRATAPVSETVDDPRPSRLVRLWPPVVLMLGLAVLALLAPLAGLAMENRATMMLIDVVVVVGLYTFAGMSGVLSFGHMSFMSIGAYAGALMTIPVGMKATLLPNLPSFIAQLELSLPVAALLAGLLAALVAAVISLPVARLPALATSLAMFAVLVIAYQVESNWSDVTRGRQAMLGVPADTGIVVALIGAVLAIAIAFAYQESARGLRLRASREDELAAAAIGVNVVRERRTALVLSGFLIGAGGALFAQYLGVFTPNDFYLDLTFVTIAMLVIGGTRSLAGAVVGPVLVVIFTYLLQQGEQAVSRPGLQQVGLAAVMLLVLIFRPAGLTNGRELPLPRVLRRSTRSTRLARRQGGLT